MDYTSDGLDVNHRFIYVYWYMCLYTTLDMLIPRLYNSFMAKEKIDRNDEIRRLRYKEGMTPIEIAERFGVSRERVRQIVGNSGRLRHLVLKDNEWMIANLHKTNREIADELGICKQNLSKYRGKYRHAVKSDSCVGTGIKWEEKISVRLSDMGIENELMPYRHPFDILAHGKVRIDVKASHGLKTPTNKGIRSPQYFFNIRKVEAADIFVFVMIPIGEVFVVPANYLHGRCISVAICWPSKHLKGSKFARFHEAWDLIEANIGEELP